MSKIEVHQHPDGFMYVRTPTATYADTIANFEEDFGVKVPPLPEGVDDRIYAPGVRHALMSTEVGLVDGGPMPWEFGDAVIAALDAGLAKQTVRRVREAPALKAKEMGLAVEK